MIPVAASSSSVFLSTVFFSDGTVRLLDLLEVLMSESGKTYIIDELDRCLHPGLTYKFVETFLETSLTGNTVLKTGTPPAKCRREAFGIQCAEFAEKHV